MMKKKKLEDQEADEARARECIWAAWNALPAEHVAPVKAITAILNRWTKGNPLWTTDLVASVVFPAEIFGEWNDDQEPEL